MQSIINRNRLIIISAICNFMLVSCPTAFAKDIELVNLFSVKKFIAYEFIITSIFLIIICLSNKMYSGKSTHDIVRLVFVFIGRFLLIILSGLTAAILYRPQNLKEIALMGLFSALISFIILSLNNFKKYYYSEEIEKCHVVRSVVYYFIIVFSMTALSAYLVLK